MDDLGEWGLEAARAVCEDGIWQMRGFQMIMLMSSMTPRA